MITYMLQVSVCWVFFYLVYLVICRNTTFFSWNRTILVGFLGMGLLIPQLKDLFQVTYTMPESIQYFYEFSEVQIAEIQSDKTAFDWWYLLEVLYRIGLALGTIRLLYGLGKIGMLYHRGERKSSQNGYTMVRTSGDHKPFSFFGAIYVSYLDEDQDLEKYIIQHELIHIRQKHSLDVVFVSILQVVFWFNPILILYRKELLSIHEYLADAEVLKSIDKNTYGHILIQGTVSRPELSFTNQFFNSQIKNRIQMMNKKSSDTRSRYRYMLLLPATCFMMILMSSSTSVAEITEKLDYMDTVVVDSIPQAPTPPTPPTPPVPPSPPTPPKYPQKQTKDTKVDQYPSKVQQAKDVWIEKRKIKKREVSYPSKNELPRFPGCEDMVGSIDAKNKCAQKKLLEYIYGKLVYPKEAQKKGTEGMVVIRFVVKKDGSLTDFTTLLDIPDGCTEAAMSVLKSMPTWIPGKVDGKVANVAYTLPIRFKLEDDDKEEQKED